MLSEDAQITFYRVPSWSDNSQHSNSRGIPAHNGDYPAALCSRKESAEDLVGYTVVRCFELAQDALTLDSESRWSRLRMHDCDSNYGYRIVMIVIMVTIQQ